MRAYPARTLLAPLAAWRIWCVRGGRALRPESWEGFIFWAAALLVLTVAEIAGFLLLWPLAEKPRHKDRFDGI